MFEKKTNGQVPACHTLLGKGTLWKGEIHTGGTSLRIEGAIEGSIHSEGEVTIAPSGTVIGTIQAQHLIVTGKAEGVFRIEQCLEIHGTGCVEGDVEVGALVVDEGGILQGTCVRRGHKASTLARKEREALGMATPVEATVVPAEPQVAVGSLTGLGIDEKPINGQTVEAKPRHSKHTVQPA
jgi:cytoskeletal protein CcmA (bactofilin family)